MNLPKTLLVDTNSYVRIARSTKCVLGDHAGIQLRLIVEIANECGRSPRLKNITPWILDPPHPKHRQDWTISTDKHGKYAIRQAEEELQYALEDALEDFANRKKERNDFRPVLSRPDKALFYTAYALGYGIVTDERPLTVACKEFEIPHLTTQGLLQYLEIHGVLLRTQIEAMVRFWQYEKDEPKDWKTEYKKLFGEPLPILKIDGS